jgi:Cysteine-rich secretory protein family
LATTLRCLTIVTAILLAALLLTPSLHAAPAQASAADMTLLNAANRDRGAAGLPALQWDAALASAARQHAELMAQRNTISHQFPGEPAMQDRARRAGARFSLIAENVAEGPSVGGLHIQWMNSPPHRANLLDPELNAVGISVVQSGNLLFAVEDFSTSVVALNLEEQEQQVASQLAARGVPVLNASSEARKTCGQDSGWTGQRPVSIVRYETADLRRLPDELDQRVTSGKYRAAAVGACDTTVAAGFARFRIAILLY